MVECHGRLANCSIKITIINQLVRRKKRGFLRHIPVVHEGLEKFAIIVRNLRMIEIK